MSNYSLTFSAESVETINRLLGAGYSITLRPGTGTAVELDLRIKRVPDQWSEIDPHFQPVGSGFYYLSTSEVRPASPGLPLIYHLSPTLTLDDALARAAHLLGVSA